MYLNNTNWLIQLFIYVSYLQLEKNRKLLAGIFFTLATFKIILIVIPFIFIITKKIRARDVAYKQQGKKITIILDTKINKAAVKIAKNSDLLISEATYTKTENNLAKEYKHLTATQAAEIAKKAKVKKLILTHLSQRYENKENLVLQEAKKIFKNTTIVNDLDKIEI